MRGNYGCTMAAGLAKRDGGGYWTLAQENHATCAKGRYESAHCAITLPFLPQSFGAPFIPLTTWVRRRRRLSYATLRIVAYHVLRLKVSMMYLFTEACRSEFSRRLMCRVSLVHCSGIYTSQWVLCIAQDLLSELAQKNLQQTELIHHAWTGNGKAHGC